MNSALIKAVVDVDKRIIAVDAELHADLESYLLSNGSEQKDLWGINSYPDFPKEDFIEFDSMINIHPKQGNKSRGVEDVNIQENIKNIVLSKIIPDIAFERALERIDLSLKTASRPTILKELCRVREMLCIAYYEKNAAEFNTFNPCFFAFALLNNNK